MAECRGKLLWKIVLESSFLVVEVGRNVIDDEYIFNHLVYFYSLDFQFDSFAYLFVLQNIIHRDWVIVRVFEYELGTQQKVSNIAWVYPCKRMQTLKGLII